MSDAGQAFQVLPLENGLVELRFDLPGESVNKFSARGAGLAEGGRRGAALSKGPARRAADERQGRLLRGRRHHGVPGALQEERGRPHALDPGDRRGLLGARGPGCALRRRDRRSRRGRRVRAVPDARATARCRRRRRWACPRRSSGSFPAGAGRCASRACAGPTPRSSGSRAASSGLRRTRSRPARWTRSRRLATCARRRSACCGRRRTASSTGRLAARRRRAR